MIEGWACKGHLRNYPAGLGEQQVFFNTVLIEPLSRVGRDEENDCDLFKAIAFLITDAVHAGQESVVTTKHGKRSGQAYLHARIIHSTRKTICKSLGSSRR